MSRLWWGLSLVGALVLGASVGLWTRAPGEGVPSRVLAAGPPSIAEIVERANPAVVQVAALDPPPREEEPADEESGAPDWRGDGAGFIIDEGGLILTNQHLVGQSPRIRVRLSSGREFRAQLIGSDSATDLALLRIDARELPVVPLGDSDRLRVGDWVVAIGNPLSFEHSVTVGVVSSKGRKIFDASFDAYIQTDAAINPGNSGGPLLNLAGEVVGIGAAVSREGQGIGFAIPVNVAKDVVAQLTRHGHVSRGYLGVQVEDLDEDLAALLGLPQARGAVVLEALVGGPGESAGLQRYDVVRGVAGQAVDDSDAFIRIVSAMAPGTQVELETWRDGRRLALTARLGERQTDPAELSSLARPAREPVRVDELGLAVGEWTGRGLGTGDGRRGVRVDNVRSLAAGAEALDRGDVIREINRQPTPTVAAYRKVVAELPRDGAAWLYVYRPRSNTTFLAKLVREEAAETR